MTGPLEPRPATLSAPWLFGTAAAFNFAIGLGLLFLRPWLAPALKLDPITGTNLVLINLAGGLIVLFGYAYALVARDPVKHRPYIRLGIIGKLLAVASALTPWLAGQISWTLPLLACGDVVFAALFVLYLRQAPVE